MWSSFGSHIVHFLELLILNFSKMFLYPYYIRLAAMEKNIHTITEPASFHKYQMHSAVSNLPFIKSCLKEEVTLHIEPCVEQR